MPSEHSFPGFTPPAAGTEAPLEMLAACHGRVERQCATLLRLAAHLPANGADEQARTAAGNVMRYFDTSARHHHQDEEVDLFPALLEAMAGSDAVCLRDLTDGLTREHRQFEGMWQGLRAILRRIADGENTLLAIETVDAFTGAYARHIEREESELLPMAARLLDDAQIGTIGAAMRGRRGIESID
jgi:hemerythrin-like domain-containing protein